MSSQLEIPLINPLKFVKVNPAARPQYFTKFAADNLFEDTIYDWQEKKTRYQPWLKTDILPLQMSSNFQPIKMDLKDNLNRTFFTQNLSQNRANKYLPGSSLYESHFDLSALPNGLYKWVLTPGNSIADQERSEWFYLCNDAKNTVLIEYFNLRFHADVVFETGITFRFRMPGFFDDKEPGSQDTLYQDQNLDQVQLDSKPFETFTFYLGQGGGVPYWFVQKMNWIISCSNVSYDGMLLRKAASAKWTAFSQEDSPVKGYAIDLMPGINRASRIINPTIDTTKKITLIYNIDQSVMGSMAPTGGTIVTPIISVE